MVAGKTDLEDHLFGKKSWLQAFSCVTVYDLSFLVTENAF